ncbi:hypothetical protein ABT317_48775, partial [Streptomyces carpinensis]
MGWARKDQKVAEAEEEAEVATEAEVEKVAEAEVASVAPVPVVVPVAAVVPPRGPAVAVRVVPAGLAVVRGVGVGADAVMSAVLCTGFPDTAHTVPSSAYSRAVTWWVPCGTRRAERWNSGARRRLTSRPSTSR